MDIIAEYVEFMAGGGRGPGGDELRRRARERLLSSGWTLYKFAKCDGRQELRYRAPHGASYISLIVACKKFQLFSAAPPRPAAPRGKPSKKRAAPDCSSGSGKGKEIARVLRYRVFGSGEEDECAPAVRNPFSGECRARHRKMRRVSALYADDALEKFAARKRKKASASPRSSASSPAASPQSPASPAASPARVLRPRPKDGDKAQAAAACLQPTRARTILAVLMDKKILPPTAKLSYRRTRDGPPVKQGTVTAQGTIRCACGCGGKAFTVAEFAAHAGGCGTERPSASVYLNDGRSLSECLVQLMRAHGGSNRTTCSSSPRARLKRRCPPELEDGDWVCSVCADFGDMLLCDCCPSAFHHGCVGLDATPQGEWFCPSCRCAACGSSEFEPADGGEFTDKTVIYCDQCELEYHAGCVRGRGDHQLERRPEGPWLCGHDCSNIFQRLQGLVGRSMPTSVDGVTFTVLRSSKLPEEEEEEAMAAEEHGRLCAAFDVLHECFITLIEPQTRTDLSHDVVFNRESELRRLNFRGFYVVGLEKGGELITVGTLRVYGKKVAELPLVGTRFVHRRQGMCRLLINQLEKLLGELGVERLVLPAVPELLPTWTGSFGFRPMSHSDRAEIAEHTVMCFQGTTMCQKFIATAAAS